MNLVKEDFYISRQKAILKEYYANNTFSDAEELKQIRDEIQSRHKKAVDEGNSIYDQVDIDKMMENDFAVRRFLVSVSGSVPKAIEKIDKCFRWRKEFKVNTTTEADLPIEFVKAGAVFPYLEDKTGRLVVYVRVKVNKKVSHNFIICHFKINSHILITFCKLRAIVEVKHVFNKILHCCTRHQCNKLT